MTETPQRHIVLFDGVCNFCNGAVNFIIRRDPQRRFAFAPLQTSPGRSLMQEYQVHENAVDMLVVIKNGRCYLGADAALEIVRDLTGPWSLLRVFKIVPRPLRDYFYKVFARNRYRLFGKKEACMIPSPDVRGRFVDADTEPGQEPALTS